LLSHDGDAGAQHYIRGLSAAALDLYRDLPLIDFSRQVLQGAESMLRVLRVPRCGWNDLGTPKRLADTLQTLPHSRERLDG
jgi:hypothetical protein